MIVKFFFCKSALLNKKINVNLTRIKNGTFYLSRITAVTNKCHLGAEWLNITHSDHCSFDCNKFAYEIRQTNSE